MRLGLLALDSNTGLGNQTWEYAQHLNPTKVLDINLRQVNASYGKTTYHYPERFAAYNTRITDGLPLSEDCEWLLDGIDILFFAETPLNYDLLRMARERGIKTVSAPNFEFLDYLQSNFAEWPKPDMFISPSLWHEADIRAKAAEWGIQWMHIPVPVNRTIFPFKPRKQAKKFLHIAGYRTHEDRNGTQTVYEAIPLVKADVQFIIRSQHMIPWMEEDYRVTVINQESPNYWEIFNYEDVLLLPRKYGGLSLQLNEGMSTGMIPIMTNIEPQNALLHGDSLIPAEFEKMTTTRGQIEVYQATPQALAEKIDWLAAQPEEIITGLSEYSNEYAGSIDWNVLAPKYLEAFEQCLKS